MNEENNVPRTQKRRRSSILKRTSHSPSRTPLGEKTNEPEYEEGGPQKRSRRSLSKRVSFSSAPQVREFQREQAVEIGAGISTGFVSRENELVRDCAPPQQVFPWLESLMSGNLRLNEPKKEETDVCLNKTILPGDAMELTLLADDLNLSDQPAEDDLAAPASTTVVSAADMSMTLCAGGHISVFIPPDGDCSEMSLSSGEEDAAPIEPPQPTIEEEAQERARFQAFLRSLQSTESETSGLTTQVKGKSFVEDLNRSLTSAEVEMPVAVHSSPDKGVLQSNQEPNDEQVQAPEDQAPNAQLSMPLVALTRPDADNAEDTQACESTSCQPATSSSPGRDITTDTCSPSFIGIAGGGKRTGQVHVTSTPLPGHSMNPFDRMFPPSSRDQTFLGFKASSQQPCSNSPILSRQSEDDTLVQTSQICSQYLSAGLGENGMSILDKPTPENELGHLLLNDGPAGDELSLTGAGNQNQCPVSQGGYVQNGIYPSEGAACPVSEKTEDHARNAEGTFVSGRQFDKVAECKPSPETGVSTGIPGGLATDTSPVWPSPPVMAFGSTGPALPIEGNNQPIEDELPFELVDADSELVSTVTGISKNRDALMKTCEHPNISVCSQEESNIAVHELSSPVVSPAEDSPSAVEEVPLISVESCLTEVAKKWPLRCNLDLSAMLPKQQGELTCADELFITTASKPCQQVTEWGLENLKEVNQRLEQRISELSSEEGQHLSTEDAKVQATCFHLTAQTEAYSYQEKVLGQLIESLQRGIAQMEVLMSTVTEHCTRLDETLQQVDNKTRVVSSRIASLEVNLPSPALRKAQRVLVEKAERQYELVQEANEDLKKSEDRQAALSQEEACLGVIIERMEAELRSQEEERTKKFKEQAAVHKAIEEVEEEWELIQGLQEWDLDELSLHTASLSFFRDSVRFNFKLSPSSDSNFHSQTDAQQIASFEMQEGPIQTPFDWEAVWFAMGKALFLDAVHPMQAALSESQTLSQMVDLLNPVAHQARLVVDQCYCISLRHNVTQSVPDRSVAVLFSNTKPLHRFTVTFLLHAETGEYQASCQVDYGPLNPAAVLLCLQSVPSGYRYLWRAVEAVKQLIASKRLPTC